jgi:peroxiredoxin
LRAYQAVLPRLRELGGELLAISPQTPDKSQATLLKNFLQYEVLSDVGNLVARSFGLVYPLGEEMRRIYLGFGVNLADYNGDESWELPLPGTFVIDGTMTIRYSFVDADYTRRLEPATILDVLERIREERGRDDNQAS